MWDGEDRVRWESEKCMVWVGRYWYLTILSMISAGRYWNSRFQPVVLWCVWSIWRKNSNFMVWGGSTQKSAWNPSEPWTQYSVDTRSDDLANHWREIQDPWKCTQHCWKKPNVGDGSGRHGTKTIQRSWNRKSSQKKQCSNQLIVMSYYLRTTLGEASAQNTSGGQRSK